MVIAMMRQTTLNVVTMEAIVVEHASTQITAQIVLALEISLEMEYKMPLLEMDFAMMKLTMKTVTMIMEIAVCLMILVPIIALNALVITKRLVQLDFFLHQLEMDIVMMTQTIQNVILMEVIAVHHASL